MLVSGKNINLRTVDINDAEFIYTLRHNEAKTRYLSKVRGTVEDQKVWIINYKQREDEKQEFYFVIESKDGDKLGLVRMYDFQNDSFCWGSWLIKEDAPKTTAIESALQIYEFGFYDLKFNQSHFDVRKGNDKVTAFHQRFGAKIVDEDELDYFFNFEKNDYKITKEKYKRYL
jgi:RimJ/RimL family protein N-acetyltransferase